MRKGRKGEVEFACMYTKRSERDGSIMSERMVRDRAGERKESERGGRARVG